MTMTLRMSQGSIECSKQHVKNILRDRLKDNESKNRSVGLKLVRFQKNASHHSIIDRSSYKALFGSDRNDGTCMHIINYCRSLGDHIQ